MIQGNIGFRKDSQDIQEVVPNLAVSIAEALTTGIIQNTATSEPYTMETDVNAVGHYVTDDIEAAMYVKALGKSMAAATSPVDTMNKE